MFAPGGGIQAFHRSIDDLGNTVAEFFRIDNFPSGNGSDPQDWASGVADSYNAFEGSSNTKNDITAVDKTAMDVIGYDLVPEPGSAILLAVAAGVLVGCGRRGYMGRA